MISILTRCPVCQGKLEVTKLKCPACRTSIEGRFVGCNFCNLSSEEQLFLEVFIVSRGNIKEVEKKLGISYPTVRNKLDSIIDRLGYTSDGKSIRRIADGRRKILDDLEKGIIDTPTALDKLIHLKERKDDESGESGGKNLDCNQGGPN